MSPHESRAAITVNRPVDEVLAFWRAREGRDIRSSGEVTFSAAPGGRGTEVRAAGHRREQVRDELRRFKQLLETGEVVRSEASPEGTSARDLASQRPAQPLA